MINTLTTRLSTALYCPETTYTQTHRHTTVRHTKHSTAQQNYTFIIISSAVSMASLSLSAVKQILTASRRVMKQEEEEELIKRIEESAKK